MSPIDGVRSEREPQCHATRLTAVSPIGWLWFAKQTTAPARTKIQLIQSHLAATFCSRSQTPSACQENKSSRGAPRLVPIAALLSEFASCGAPQSARALWPLWPDIRGVRAVLTATARRPYRRHALHNWLAISPRQAPAPYLPRGWRLASESRKNKANRPCRSFR